MRRLRSSALSLLLVLGTRALAAQRAPSLEPAAIRGIVDSVATVLEPRYVNAAIATRLSAMLRANAARGKYDAMRDPVALAIGVQRDMQQVVADKHLRLSYEPQREFTLGTGSPGGAATGVASGRVGPRFDPIDGRDSIQFARTNFAFERVERLAGNVGYLRLGQFVPLEFSRATATAAMAFLASSDAVILDLRDNVGGSPQLVEFMLSYFYGSEPVKLLTTYNRATNTTVSRTTLASVPGARLTTADLYVLTSGNSASAAEMLAYAVQQTGRGKVVGERSAGAGNGGAKLSVGGGIALFVPQFQVVSGPGYESTGVAPDVAVDADRALAVAHETALRTLVAKSADTASRREREWALELVKAQQVPSRIAVEKLRELAGAYEGRTVEVVGDSVLVNVGSTGWRTKLVPVGTDSFRTSDVLLRFERDGAGKVVALVTESVSGRTARYARRASA